MHPYEWVVLRVVPRVDRQEFVNAGVVVYCQQRDFLQAAVDLDDARARALDPTLDLDAVRRHLQVAEDVCAGRGSGGPCAGRPPGERFRWLVAPRSTVVQPSPVHTGLTDDPAAELARLVDSMVRPPA